MKELKFSLTNFLLMIIILMMFVFASIFKDIYSMLSTIGYLTGLTATNTYSSTVILADTNNSNKPLSLDEYKKIRKYLKVISDFDK